MATPYKTLSVADELAYLMDKELKSEAAENSTGANKLQEGLNCLHKAAGMLEHLREHKAAEAITVIIEKMAGK
jgi:hypothetical protein